MKLPAHIFKPVLDVVRECFAVVSVEDATTNGIAAPRLVKRSSSNCFVLPVKVGKEREPSDQRTMITFTITIDKL